MVPTYRFDQIRQTLFLMPLKGQIRPLFNKKQATIRYGVVANIARSHWSDPSSPGFDSLYRSLFLAFLPSVVHFYFC